MRHFNYKQIPTMKRANAGTAALASLQRMLTQPVSEEQRTAIMAQINRVTGWMNGTLPEPEPEEIDVEFDMPEPVHHNVEVSEQIGIKATAG